MVAMSPSRTMLPRSTKGAGQRCARPSSTATGRRPRRRAPAAAPATARIAGDARPPGSRPQASHHRQVQLFAGGSRDQLAVLDRNLCPDCGSCAHIFLAVQAIGNVVAMMLHRRVVNRLATTLGSRFDILVLHVLLHDCRHSRPQPPATVATVLPVPAPMVLPGRPPATTPIAVPAMRCSS